MRTAQGLSGIIDMPSLGRIMVWLWFADAEEDGGYVEDADSRLTIGVMRQGQGTW